MAYSHLWAGDQRRKLFANLDHHGAEVVLGSVTAPGVDRLPWDEEHCAGLGEHHHSGALGCRVARDAARAWNEDAPKQWRRLHRRAYERVRRRHNVTPRLLVRVWEMQHRGVLHVHPVLAFRTPAERFAARHYMAALHELAPQYGFGFTERRLVVLSHRAAAAYLSAYFVQGAKGKATLQESVVSKAMPRSIVHVSTSLTQATGITMRELRFRRFVWFVANKSDIFKSDLRIAREIALAWREHGGVPPREVQRAIIRKYEPDDQDDDDLAARSSLIHVG